MSGTQARSRQALEQMLPTLIHALRTPLSGLAMGIEVAALRLRRHDDAAGFLEPMRDTLHEMSGTLDQLARYVRLQDGEMTQVDVASYFGEVVRRWQMGHPTARVMWDKPFDGPKAHLMALDLDTVPQAVGHLLDNASEAGGLMPIGLSLVHAGEGKLRLSVRNAGSPIAQDVLPRMTEPFFTTKHRRLGLGLAFADYVARSHEGHISVDTSAVGTVVGLHLSAKDNGAQHAGKPSRVVGD